jgi:hypothetical protein
LTCNAAGCLRLLAAATKRRGGFEPPTEMSMAIGFSPLVAYTQSWRGY